MANIRKAGHNKLDGHVPIQICPWLHWMLDNGDKVLDGETNKELATVASFLATRGVISDVISSLSVIGTIKYYTFPSVQMLHECTFLFKNVNCILCDCMCLCKSYTCTYVHMQVENTIWHH